MESREYKGGFEDFLQEKADQYKLYPSDRVWNAINNRLHPRKKWSYLVVAAIFIGLGIGGKVYDSSLVTELVSQNHSNNLEQIDEQTAETGTPGKAPVIPITSRVNSVSPADKPIITPSSAAPKFSSLETGVESGVVPMFETNTVEVTVNDEDIQALTSLTAGTSEQSTPTHQNTGNDILDEMAVHEISDAEFTRTNAIAIITSTDFTKAGQKDLSISKIPAPEKASSIKVLKPKHLNIGWQLYASPTVSYRKLSGEGMKYYNTSSLNSVFTADVEKSVRHKPSIGFELGTALTYATGPNFRFKTGLQLNINRYEVQAYNYVAEVAPLTPGGIGHTTINAISTYRNFNGFSKTWLKNQHIMMSVPLGAELTLFGSDNVKFNIGGTLQPTFVLNNQAYMISTNMKNYAQEPSLYKKFNVAAGAEAYISIKSGSYRWMIGPQFRYQIFSSYKKEYPINEHLTDYGFKIGISR
ncbi:MAG TPA: hypothetical protein VFX73_00460 [Chitinophagaceae bacterium]|nr:hypothetical protein [Chitinophagaceae bacterium]